MANDLTGSPHLWILDSVGILSETPVWIERIVYIPAAAGNDLVFKQWEGGEVANGTKDAKTGTIATNNTLTSTGNLPSDIADGHIFEIWKSSGAAANKAKRVVETAGDNNAVVIQEDDWTDETAIYSWRTFATVNAIVLKAGASDASPIHFYFTEKGREFPNLTLETISGGTAYVYLRQV